MFSKISTLTERLDNIADRLQKRGFNKEAEEIDVVSNTLEKMAKKIPAGSDRPAPIFSDSDPDVTDGKDHYPIPDERHARSALQRLSQFWDSKPSWWKGSLETLRSKIISAVKSKFPDMKIDEEKFKDAAETNENILTAALSECEALLDLSEGFTIDANNPPEITTFEQFAKEGAKKQRAGAIFQGGSPNVTDGNDHFPITSKSQAQNALARSHQYSSAPSWYNGTLSSLQSAVSRAVHAKYPGIKISKK